MGLWPKGRRWVAAVVPAERMGSQDLEREDASSLQQGVLGAVSTPAVEVDSRCTRRKENSSMNVTMWLRRTTGRKHWPRKLINTQLRLMYN